MSITSGDTVLVTGATGFTGRHLVRTLCDTGANVRAIVRASSDRSGLGDLPVEFFEGEVYDPEVALRASEGVNYIFHVAAAFREAKVGDEIYGLVHVESTKNLARAVTGSPGFKRFVHVSTMGVHGHIETPPADETSRFAPGDLYQETKVEGELWIRDHAEKTGMPLTVIRPCGIYGPGDRRLLKVFKMARLPIVPLLGLGSKGLYHLVHVRDLVDFMVLAARHEATLGEVYLCGAAEPIRLRDMIGVIAEKLGTAPRFLRLPVTPFFVAGDICEAVCKPFGIEPPIYRRRVAFFTKDRAFDTSKMRRHTGFRDSYTNETGLTDLAEWYLREGWL
ncbi:MAG: NAD-dependent epimerase/dehydratase family protein [Paracoccaceae bacterium]|nr:NAD-dependent epimerase/dehydratase family protein [Paracoccaceae bacterium]